MDTRPGFDDTGVLVVALVIAAFVVVVIDGSASVLRVAMLAALVGIWIPVLEIAPPGSTGPLLALVFAGLGASAGAVLLRSVRGCGA